MSKYTKGWLCRDFDDYSTSFLLWFYNKKPKWNDSNTAWYPSNNFTECWEENEFNNIYDCNFPLPKAGEKVECWCEL